MRRLLVLLCVGVLFSCSKNRTDYKLVQGQAFGTSYNIQFYSDHDFDVEKGLDSIVEIINQSVSTYIPDSDISRINTGDSTIVVDDIFKQVFLISQEIHKQTEGYFDPTIGVLRNAYGFGDVKPLKQIDSIVLDSLMRYVGFDKVKLNPDNTITKNHPEIYFDFNAVAKGYGLDVIGSYLDSKGIENYLIELGGEILAKGKNLEKDDFWIVGIETIDSDLEDRSFGSAVRLNNVGLAASGNYRKFRMDSLTGKKFVHTLNPLTGSAEESDVTSATVIAPSCGVADAYATSFMALGLEKSKTLLESLPEVEAYLTYKDSLQHDRVFITEGFKNLLVD